MLQDQVLADRYRLTGQLGVGGMAVVWKAHDELLNRHVAVKVLAGAQAAGPAARRRVLAEAQAAAQVWHPHVANIYDYGEVIEDSGDRVPYVVMELLPGRTLAQRLAAGPLPPRTALRICAEVAGALAAAHARNVVHRDVKPANVMLTPSGAKVVDFGLAAIAGQPDIDEEGQLLGTAAYLAPERLTGDEVLPASDVYALGLLIHRALTDTLPWDADTPSQMLNAHVYVEPTPLKPIDGVLPEVNRICDRCLAKDPADRPSAAEVAAVLADAAGIVPLPVDDLAETAGPELTPVVLPAAAPAGPAPGVGAGPGRPRRRRAVIAGAAVAAAAVVAAVLVAPDARPGGDRLAAAPSSSATTLAGTSAAVPGGPAALPPSGRGPTAGPTGTAQPTDGSTPPPAPTTAAGPGPTPDGSAAPPPAPELPGVPVRALGGVLRVQCNGKKAQGLSLDAAAGYTVQEYKPGPADEVKAVLVAATNRSDIKVRCSNGAPAATVKETPPKP